jgi:Ca2+-transporting ATPase
VHAVELGRIIYDKVVCYIRYQMSQLISLILLFLAASVFDVNDGVAMTPTMVLYLNFFIAVTPVIMILTDPTVPGIMDRPPRDPKQVIANRAAVTRWLFYGLTIFIVSFIPLLWGPDNPSPDRPSASMTMTMATLGFATVISGLLLRRYPSAGLEAPILGALKIAIIPVALVVLGTELGFLQEFLMTEPLTGYQWLACIALAAVVGVLIEADKWWLRRQAAKHRVIDIRDKAVATKP